MLPSNQRLAKLRILLRRAEERERLAKGAHDLHWLEHVKPASDEVNVIWQEYAATLRDLGYCAHCEKQLSECRCVTMASFREPPIVVNKGDFTKVFK